MRRTQGECKTPLPADTMADMPRANQAYTVVIDSFKAIHDLTDTRGDAHLHLRLTIELSAMLTALWSATCTWAN